MGSPLAHGESSTPRATVIVPAFNSARTIEETIRSVLNQTERGVEVVVVDDGSTDETRSVVARLASVDGRVTLIAQRNQGPAAARNLGATRSTSRYLCFLDADDSIEPEKLRTQCDRLDAMPEIAVTYCATETYLDGQSDTRRTFSVPPDGPALAASVRSGGLAFPIHAALIRKSAFDACGGFRPLEVVEDTFLWTRMAAMGMQFDHVSVVMALYRLRPDSFAAVKSRRLRGRLGIVRWLELNDRAAPPALVAERRQRKRWLAVRLIGELAREGHPVLARWQGLRSLSGIRRPGELLESLRFLMFPVAALAGEELG